MTDIALLPLVLLCVAALCAGFVDAIAGGGGLITLPALFTAGLPAHVALGTNKGQSVFGSFAALMRFRRAGLLDSQRARWTFPFGLAGALGGAALVMLLKPAVLRPVVLVLLVGVAVFLAFRRAPARVEPESAPARMARRVAVAVAFVIGAYDGFFGPGTGTFLIIAFVALAGDSLSRASGNAKVVNFASNLASMAVFASSGVILWKVALPMAAAQAAGGWLGAHTAVQGGDVLVRRVVLCVVCALCLKLGWDMVRG
ncbi:MAG: TSUP family transporter [Myxococcaceae bacterium]|nr:TSUP family transporter [Myxococcaceae bacterium]MCI0673407.1 TSUP family transporter [Myxococcaceae bacterium]